ncbi:RHS repeat protein [Acinetobacter seifertii]|nr:RHS repeat protein [Acinetobacter seifertii]
MISYTDCSGKSSTWEYNEDGALTAEQTANNKLYSIFTVPKAEIKDSCKELFILMD